MIKTLNLSLKTIATLQNALNISYTKEVNQIWLASFSLPFDDSKNAFVKELEYVDIHDDVSDEYVGLFRVMDSIEQYSEETKLMTYNCVHVLHTLADAVINGYYQKDNLTTSENINELLKLQPVKDWYLKECDFRRFFSYSWENENGIVSPIFSIPKPFNEPYIFEHDTTSYPWALSLKKPSDEVMCRIKETHNLKGLEVKKDPNSMVNRIHAKGIGEGVNSLTFETINSGKDYVQNDEAIAKLGGRIIPYVWFDRRFTDKESLLASAKGLLDKWSKPVISWKVSAIDLNKIHIKQTGKKLEIDNFKLGEVVQLDTKKYGKQDLRIMKIRKNDITGSPWDIELELGTVTQTFGGTLADSERQNEINTHYANGATNMFLLKESGNADSTHPIKLWFNLDNDVAMINQVRLDVETSAFRADSRTTSGGGGTVASTTSGGGSVQGGTSAAGGATQVGSTSASGGDHRHRMFASVGMGPIEFVEYGFVAHNQTQVALRLSKHSPVSELWTEGTSGAHSHNVTVNVPNHTHNFSFNVPAHSHQVTLPDHVHGIEFGIFELSDRATALIIKVDGVVTPLTDVTLNFANIIPYLSKGEDGLITKTRHTIEITPNERARISAQITCRVFIRSQIGGEF